MTFNAKLADKRYLLEVFLTDCKNDELIDGFAEHYSTQNNADLIFHHLHDIVHPTVRENYWKELEL